MGWLFQPGSTRKGLIAERITGWERTTPDGMTVKSTCIAHCYRGGNFSGVLWTVWERTFEKDEQSVKPTERWIGCDLLEYSKRDEGWGYKDMEESMGPYFFSCPLKYLEMVPVVGSESWRESVRAYHARQQEKRRAKKQMKEMARKAKAVAEKPKPYDQVGAIMAYEDGDLDDEQVIELFQHLIDTGLAWQLQGSYGRTAVALIQQGACHQ